MRLSREEYVEQAHFFQALIERLDESVTLQDLMSTIRHELLVTTKLPMAVEFLLVELRHTGCFGTAMKKLAHYFTPFQTYVIQEAEDDRGRFDMRVALAILAKEAEYKRDGASEQGLFLYQFEALCRNRMNYDKGFAAIALDPQFDEAWRNWILTVRRQIGLVDTADLIFVRSRHYFTKRGIAIDDAVTSDSLKSPLFGEQEGQIAWATRRKDPLLLFAALQRQLGYPKVPRQTPADEAPRLLPELVRRMERVETRLKLLEEDQKGGIDITKFFAGPDVPNNR
ncbi:MAG: hypothetical protein KDB27_35870 [Planctomycetales bacterium]|nr:hypothetical protein [Planctomycetales bacterium]